MKRTLLLLFTCLATTLFAHAQSNEVTLVVSGEGPNKTEATALALRSAIEQAYGTFVSANTEILNDEIVRDEIATVASGNIKSYKEISSVQTTEGYYVTVQAVVSIGKLIEYSKSHGSSAEFSGQAFAMNIKMRKLNKENEAKALKNLVKELKEISKSMFDYSVTVNEPYKGGRHEDGYNFYVFGTTISYKSNEATKLFYETLYNTLKALSLTDREREEYWNTREDFYTIEITGLPSETWKECPLPPYNLENDPKRKLYYSDYKINAILRNDPQMFLEQLNSLFHTAVYVYPQLKLEGLDFRYSFRMNLQNGKRTLNLDCNRNDGNIRGTISLHKHPKMGDYFIDYKHQSNLDGIKCSYEIEGLRLFSYLGSTLFELCFDIPVKEENIMNLNGFSVYSIWSASSSPGSQNTDTKAPTNQATSQPAKEFDGEVYQIVEEMPEFLGGMQKLMEFISNNIQYPQLAREKGVQGRVFVSFIVEPDGSISNANTTQGIGGGCDEEAVRVVKSMPKWKPGKQRGQAVRVSYQIPITFKLYNEICKKHSKNK